MGVKCSSILLYLPPLVSNQSKAVSVKPSLPSPSKAHYHPTFASNRYYVKLIYRETNKKEYKKNIFNFYLESMFWNTSKTNTFGASTQAARAQSLTTPPMSPENKAKNYSSWNVFRIKMNFLDSKYKWLVNPTITQHADNEKYYKVLKNIRSHLGFSYPAGVIAQTQACPYAWKKGQKNLQSLFETKLYSNSELILKVFKTTIV